jgi:hypothetical protein
MGIIDVATPVHSAPLFDRSPTHPLKSPSTTLHRPVPVHQLTHITVHRIRLPTPHLHAPQVTVRHFTVIPRRHDRSRLVPLGITAGRPPRSNPCDPPGRYPTRR